MYQDSILHIFFKNDILKNVKKIEIHMDSEKLINSFEIKKSIGYLIIYWAIILFTDLLITFRHYYWKKIKVLYFFHIGDFFQIFIISRNTEILIQSNYSLEIGIEWSVSYILKYTKNWTSEKIGSYENCNYPLLSNSIQFIHVSRKV